MRYYYVQFSGFASANQVDFFELTTTSAVSLALCEVHIGQTTELGDTAEEALPITVKRATGSYTSGSGGSAGTLVAAQPADASATATAEVSNTTQIAVGTGALTTILTEVFNVRVGWHFTPDPDSRPKIAPSSALAVGLGAAPADSITWAGYAVLLEMG